MELTNEQRKIINELLCVIAEMRIHLERESQGHVINSINMRTLSSKLQETYQKGASLLKPSEEEK